MEIDEASLLQDESNQNYEYKRVNDEMMKALKAIKILDLESLWFEKGGHLMTNKEVSLPAGSKKI